jgi:hypothetical protein
MALRVARGLFRLWLVLSVLWIGGVAVETWWTFPVHGVPISILDIAEPHGPLALAGDRTIGERKPASAFDLTQGGHRPQR